MSKRALIIFGLLAVLLISLMRFVQFTITGNFEGIFLLRGEHGAVLEIKDDLYLNEGQRYILGIDIDREKQAIHDLFSRDSGKEPHLSVAWNEGTGVGYVRNYLSGGKELITCFSRFLFDGREEVKGLFVGGGLPAQVRGDDRVKLNETGMAYFNGKRWLHLWCNVNEGLFSPSSFDPVAPPAWKFLRSAILHHNAGDLILESEHEALIDGVPLHMSRYAHFRAGETYFLLSIVLRNSGDRPATFYYLYGDEPWLGDYGSSKGNVGWAADGLHQFVGRLDVRRGRYAGFFDYGNDAIEEGHDFTMAANFIEWFGGEQPTVYFTNGPYDIPRTGYRKQPLASNTRFLGVLWGPRTLGPGESVTYTLAIGMADHDPRTGFPVVPEISPENFP